jgi:glycosyltransferase involved in cell wall biosynthesis
MGSLELEERNDAEQVFAGRLTFAVPGDLDTPTGGYRYDRRIILELRRLGWCVDVLDIGGGFPFPSPSSRDAAMLMLRKAPLGNPIVIDGLAFGALPEAGVLGDRTPLVALVHQPLALEPALTSVQAEVFRRSERAALAAAANVVVTSETTGRILIDDYGVQLEHVSVVPPGNDPAPQAHGSRDGIVRLLAVGSVVPGKGFDVLIRALAMIADLPWQLNIVGDLGRDVEAAAQLRHEIKASGLDSRVTLLGALPADRVMEQYLASDLFVLASRFESYGMALAEALSHGLPVVSTTAGAIPDTVPANAGILVPPDNAPAFAHAMSRLIGDAAERCRLARNACRAAARLPSWEESARRFATAVQSIESPIGGR